jgi:hypothetical protein
MQELPPAAELFTIDALAARHPQLLSKNRIMWAVRHRQTNGLSAANAVYENPYGGFVLHEPATLSWWLGLSGRAKPRAARPKKRATQPA